MTKTAGNPFFALQFLLRACRRGIAHLRSRGTALVLGSQSHPRQGLCRQCRGPHGREARPPAGRNAEGAAGAGLSRQRRRHRRRSRSCSGPRRQVHAALWEAVRLELVERLPGAYRFVHDRVQEAAYSLIPAGAARRGPSPDRAASRGATPPEKREEAIFEIVGQLNRGAALIASQDEREHLAEFNLHCGQARQGRDGLRLSAQLSGRWRGAAANDCWKRRHELAFALELNRAECEFLTGDLAAADERLADLSKRACDHGRARHCRVLAR